MPTNLEIVLDAYARFNSGNREPQMWHDDGEYHATSIDPDLASLQRSWRRQRRPD